MIKYVNKIKAAFLVSFFFSFYVFDADAMGCVKMLDELNMAPRVAGRSSYFCDIGDGIECIYSPAPQGTYYVSCVKYQSDIAIAPLKL